MSKPFKEKFLGEFVYGAIDGTITTFAIISGVIGAALSPSIILVLGFANVLADGFSMGASNYLASKSENDLSGGSQAKPLHGAFVTFLSFIIVGSVPLISFVLEYVGVLNNPTAIRLSLILTGLVFLLIGAIKGYITKKNTLASALETFLIGSLAAGISFAVGYFLQGLI